MGIKDFFAPRTQLLKQQQRIRELEQELTELRTQNDSMREGMRRCMTCDYRIEVMDKRKKKASLSKKAEGND